MKRRICAVVLSAALLLALGASGAAAEKGNGRTRTGPCSLDKATFTLSVKHTSGSMLQVQFAVKNAGVGSTWMLFGSDNGTRIFSVSRIVTLSNVAKVTRTIEELDDDDDAVKATANNLLTGEICQATVTI